MKLKIQQIVADNREKAQRIVALGQMHSQLKKKTEF